ncbi:TadE family protein [Anaerolentibacter hominis]|uniref:TadE family protein n=1 Tax=Anaerolentibacter hominis TaxID=3079009 RepID=UPI0031B86D7D
MDLRKRVMGSYTVEAALIMPIVIVIITALMMLCMYLHDKVVLESTADAVLDRGGRLIRDAADVETGRSDYRSLSGRSVYYPFQDKEKEETDISYRVINGLKGKGMLLYGSGMIMTAVSPAEITITVTYSKKGASFLMPDTISLTRRLAMTDPEELRRGLADIDGLTEKSYWMLHEHLDYIGDLFR